MTDFLIKSTIALCVLLGTYHLLLEKEKFHQFNRFFLLGSLIVSFIIPFVTIEIIQEVSTVTTNTVAIPGQITAQIIEEKTPVYVLIGWILYGIITTVLFIRFINNLKKMMDKTKSGIRIKHQNATLVLLKEQTLPYTFLNTIFINEEEYQNKKIEAELFTHELIHVNQKHSLDILLIEIIKTIFWFNPIFIFYKKAIQLNHEFLADEKVVKSHNNVSFYQNLLLAKANQSPIYYLASNLNYSVTKKRLIMMTTTTSRKMAFVKKITITPIVAILVAFLCFETVAQEVNNNGKKESVKKTDIEKYYSKTTVVFKDKKTNTTVQKKYSELSEADKRRIPPPPPILAKKSPTSSEFEKFKDKTKFAVWIDKKNVDNSVLSQYSAKDFVLSLSSFIYKNARSEKFPQEYQVTLYTNKGYTEAFEQNREFAPEKVVIMADKNRLGKDEPKKQDGFAISYDTTSVKEPVFPGGMTEFYKFIGKNFKTPVEASKNKIEGKLDMQFMVEKDGSLSEFKIVKDPGYGLGEEAIRVLKLSPKWIPASRDGKPVRVTYSLPITIQSEK